MQSTHDPAAPEPPDLRAEFERWAPAALQKVVDLMQHARHERTQLQAAQVILEYTARKPSAGLDVRLTHDFGRTVAVAMERRRTWLLQAHAREESAGPVGSGELLSVETPVQDTAAAAAGAPFLLGKTEGEKGEEGAD